MEEEGEEQEELVEEQQEEELVEVRLNALQSQQHRETATQATVATATADVRNGRQIERRR